MGEVTISNPYGPIDPQRLAAFEARIGSPLPDQFRRFLARYNGAELTPCELVLPGQPEPFTLLSRTFGLHGADGDLSVAYDNCQDIIPAELLAFAEDYGGNLFCIGVRGECRGRVYFWDHHLSHPGDEEPNWDGLTLLAGSFDSFVVHLGREQPGG